MDRALFDVMVRGRLLREVLYQQHQVRAVAGSVRYYPKKIGNLSVYHVSKTHRHAMWYAEEIFRSKPSVGVHKDTPSEDFNALRGALSIKEPFIDSYMTKK